MSSTVAPSSMTSVYSLLREPSLALFWTHLITPSTYGPSYAGILPIPGSHLTELLDSQAKVNPTPLGER